MLCHLGERTSINSILLPSGRSCTCWYLSAENLEVSMLKFSWLWQRRSSLDHPNLLLQRIQVRYRIDDGVVWIQCQPISGSALLIHIFQPMLLLVELISSNFWCIYYSIISYIIIRWTPTKFTARITAAANRIKRKALAETHLSFWSNTIVAITYRRRKI